MSNALLPHLIEDKALRWQLTLYNMVEEPIAVLQYENLNFNRKFDDYDELSFTVPRYIYDRFEKKHIDNPTWFKIKAGMVVRLDIYEENGNTWENDFSEYFSIQQPSFSESADNNDKQFSCVALHQILFNKIKLRGYNDIRKLIEPNVKGMPYERDEEGNIISGVGPTALEANESHPYEPVKHDSNDNSESNYVTFQAADNTKGGILDYILEYLLPDWRIAYYDEALLDIAQQNKISSEDNSEAINKLKEVAYEWHRKQQIDWDNIEDNIVGDKGIFASLNLRGTQDSMRILRSEWNILTSSEKNSAGEFLIWCDKLWDSSEEEFYEECIINGIDYSIKAIIAEPLKGSMLLTYAEQAITAIESFIRTISEAKYIDDVYESEQLSEVTTELQNFARAILEEFIEPLSFYKSATGSVPYRSLKLDTTLVDMFKQLEENYLCVFKFNNIKKLIYIYGRDNEKVDKQSSLIISPENIMTDIQYQATTDQITTRLYPKGKDDIQIGGYTINGMNYVDNFSYYIENGEMPLSLANKVKKYVSFLEDIKKIQMAWDSYEIHDVREIYEHDSHFFQRSRLNSLAYLASIGDEEAANFLEENLLIKVKYYKPHNGASGKPSIKGENGRQITNIYTLKGIQDKIVELSNQLIICQSYARQWIIADDSRNPTTGERTDDSSWWYNQESRAAIDSATNTNLSEIEAEMGIYLDGFPESYREAADGVMPAFWDMENNSPTDTNSNYLSKNIKIFQDKLVEWQKKYQYNFIKSDIDVENYSWLEENLFTELELTTLQNFVYEEDITWNTITTADSLYLYASLYLDYKKKIPVTIDLGTVDILSNYRYQFDWSKISDVGSRIYVDFKDFQLDYDIYKIMSFNYSISPTDRNIKITLSNSYDLTTLMSQLVTDVWAYTYKQLQDISKYKKTWEEFMAKQDSLLSQGEDIYADVTSIVDNAGKVVVGGDGLVLSGVKYNSLRKNADGYYVRDKTISDGKIDSETQKTKKYISDHIVFEGATVTQSMDSNGETTLTISGMGGGGGDTNTGLPRYYSAPYFSTSLNILDARRVPPKTTIEEKDYVFYQEVTENQEYIWYQAELNKISGEEEDPPDSKNGYKIIQAKDQNNKPLYWVDYTKTEDQLGQTIINVDNCCYMTTAIPTEYQEETKVMIYEVDNNKKLEIFRLEQDTVTHLPRLIWGLGSGVGNNDKCIIEKVTHGLNAYIQTNEDDSNKVRGLAIRHRNAGDNITALNGLYQIRNSGTTVIDDNLYPIPVCHFTTSIDTVGNDLEQGDLIYVYQ